jgi:redox-sensitive bicupin YhaK (pirin superfamily)
MKTILRSGDRGKTDLGWLDSKHSFSFGEYYDPQRMGFRSLRVLNDDIVAPGGGFGLHPHRDMEIVTYVISGALQHKDSLGNEGVIQSGQIQHIHAGKGIAHSEFNASQIEPVHFMQIWIVPRTKGTAPEYHQKEIPVTGGDATLTLLASGVTEKAAITVDQDVTVSHGRLRNAQSLDLAPASGRHGWLQVIGGELEMDGLILQAGDALQWSDEGAVRLSGASSAEFLYFDLG